MIVEEGKYYLYRHIRLDKNEPFYIGVGTTNERDLNSKLPTILYRRAYTKSNRSMFWERVIKKTKYEVDIILVSEDYDFILEKEIEFIKLYGRRINGGTLVNLDDGGRGGKGYVWTKKMRKKASERFKKRIGKLHHKSKEVFVYNIDGDYLEKYESYRGCAEKLNLDKGCITQCISGKIQQCFGYVFKNSFVGEKIKINYNNKRLKKVILLDKDTLEEIKEFKSVTEAAKYLGSETTNVSKCCKNIKFLCKNHRLKYGISPLIKNEETNEQG